ncbi:MAG: lasso peptide biosynthesis B2 protein [Acidobacteria bacterium]|nr:lasso peptide biosynthesis B2 protein [Acidobacteriota bacterium]
MTDAVSRLRGLSRSDWRVLLDCAWAIPAVEFDVRWRAPRRWLPQAADSTLPSASPLSTAAADRVAHLVDAVYRQLPVEPTCLTRSLVLYRLLRARGIPCQLRIGLRRNQSALEGHAWTETGRPDAAGAESPDAGRSDAANYEVVLSF